MTTIVGRDTELRVGDAYLADAARGRAALVVEGEAGIGKTTLWEAIADRAAATGFLVLRARPTEAEAPLTLAVLGDLLESIPERTLGALPPVQRRALDAALLRVEPTADGLRQRLLGTATRTVLLALAVERPVLVAIDDVQWADAASTATLAYALRRLDGARVSLLVARRTGQAGGVVDPGLLSAGLVRHEVALGPLTLAALHHVLKERFGVALPRTTLVRVHQASGGHPLFALEIARLLQDAPEPRPDRPLPVPATVRELVVRRVGQLPPSTREVLLVVAADSQPTVEGIAAALGRSIRVDLEVAAREDVAKVDDGRIAFAHPLFAAAIYAAATDQERQAAHAQLAAATDHAEERARHRALAASGPDGEVASALEHAAREAGSRAAPLAGAELMRAAIRLTPDGDRAAVDERSLALAELLKLGGDGGEARRVLEALVQTASTSRLRARARLALANVIYDIDPGPRSAQLATDAIADADEPELLAFAHATLSAVEYADRQRFARHAREAMRLLATVRDPSPVVETLVLYQYAGAEIDDGRPVPMDVVDRALALERVKSGPIVSDRLSASLGYWLLIADDDIDGARPWMEATLAAVIDEGDEGSLPYALSHFSQLELAAGDWERAEDAARRHLAAAAELGQESQRLAALYSLASVMVLRGRGVEARPLIDELLREAEQAESLWDLAKGWTVLGALELSIGNAAAAADALGRAESGRDELGDEMHRPHEADLVEALVEAGRLDQARALADVVEDRARRFRRHSRRALAARSRALVAAADGDLDGAVAALDEALHEHDLAPFPFDRARTQLVLGRVRRRRRERSLAKEAFAAALAGFEALGAAPWSARTRAELNRVGLRRRSGAALTEGERRAAELAATGMTNRDVAAALFLSPKTVEVNLSRAYQKLGVRSRAELGALVARGGLEEPPPA